VTPRSLPPAAALPTELRPWLSRRLLPWFRRQQRQLPWRRDRDPYRIWVSEVMLQQTQVATVISYFERFLAKFPTLERLAAADEQDVLRLWEGLGYYRRARDLHRAARLLVKQHNGQLPDDSDALQDLPSFGRYTRNAVLSQAFDRRLPILEANSQRVLSRLFARREDPRTGPARRWLWQAAEELLPTRHVGEFNQALMEFGALVCTPISPRCTECPLATRCGARQLGIQDSIPPKAPAPETVPVQESAVVVRRRGRVLLVQRPEQGRWANLWEFPHGPVAEGETHETAAARLLPELSGFQARIGPELLTVRHGITRFQITLVCFEADQPTGRFHSTFYQDARWLLPEDVAAYPVSVPQRRLAKALTAPSRQRRLF
jgi:A/G-specific adenine glycosylase